MTDTETILADGSEAELTVIATDLAPAAIGPYSQAIRLGDFVFCSGQLPINPETQIMGETIAEQAKQAILNLQAVLEAAGSDLDHVVKTTCFMTDLKGFAEFNAVYAEFFKENPPARSAVEVKALPKGAAIEIEAIAYIL